MRPGKVVPSQSSCTLTPRLMMPDLNDEFGSTYGQVLDAEIRGALTRLTNDVCHRWDGIAPDGSAPWKAALAALTADSAALLPL
jgi:hypothetical protein